MNYIGGVAEPTAIKEVGVDLISSVIAILLIIHRDQSRDPAVTINTL